MVDKEEFKYLEGLCKIRFEKDELEKVTSRLNDVLGHLDNLGRVDTEGIKPTSHVIEITNAFREDVPGKSISRKEALKNAPDTEGHGFKIPDLD
jgi:aspartyl-tRNA(Asn)/glutamyl-tRNA(Gln) amidotransferase subunit C